MCISDKISPLSELVWLTVLTQVWSHALNIHHGLACWGTVVLYLVITVRMKSLLMGQEESLSFEAGKQDGHWTLLLG